VAVAVVDEVEVEEEVEVAVEDDDGAMAGHTSFTRTVAVMPLPSHEATRLVSNSCQVIMRTGAP
jgi:hypothetical protein